MKKIILSIFATLALGTTVMANNIAENESKNITKIETNEESPVNEDILILDCADVYHQTYYRVTHLMKLGSEIGEFIADIAYDQCVAKQN